MRIKNNLKPVIKPYSEGCMILCETYQLDTGDHFFNIPKGFIFDGASIPRVVKSSVSGSFDPQYVAPALIHDWCYIFHKCSNKDITRKQSDKLFKTLLKHNNVGWYTRGKMYNAVRMFGGFCWNKKESEDKLKERYIKPREV